MFIYFEFSINCVELYIGRGPPRFEGDRPRFGDRDGYRSGPRGGPGDFGGEKSGAPADYQPSFRVRDPFMSNACHCLSLVLI